MTTKEKFEKTISTIEENLDNCLRPREIAEIICSDNFISFRDMDAIFKYLIDYSLLEYIKERKMMYACRKLMDGYSIEKAVDYSGYDNQSSFSKRFKEVFATSPKEAQKSADKSIIKPMVKWDDLSMDSGKETVFEGTEISETFKFGLSLKQYKLISEAENLQALYEFNDVQSDVAFEIATKENVSLKTAFNFVEHISIKYSLFDDNADKLSKEYFGELINENKLLYKLYLQHLNGEVDIEYCLDILSEAKGYGIDLFEIEKMYLIAFSETSYHIKELPEIIEQFKKFNGDFFEEYLQLLGLGFSYQDAAEGIKYEDDYDEYKNESHTILPFEEIDEIYEDDFNQDIYDADNPCYNDDEDDEFEGFQIP